MALPDDLPPFSFSKSSSRDRKVTCETLSRVDWSRTRPFEARFYHSDGDDDFSWGIGPVGINDSVDSAAPSKGLLAAGNSLFACFPPMMSPARDVRRVVADFGGRPRTYPSPIPHSGSIPHSGPLKLNTGPIISHSGTLKGSAKGVTGGPSIIPSDVAGKKTRPGSYDVDEPTSPEVTCLGRVRIKQKHYKDLAKGGADKRQFSEWKSKLIRKKGPPDSIDKGNQSPGRRAWGGREATDPQALSGDIDFNINLGRFSSGRSVLSSIISSEGTNNGGGRGAISAKSLAHLLAEDEPQNEEELDANYILPQVPQSNSLLLIPGSRELVPEQASKDPIRRQVSLPKPSSETSLWKRRAVAQPSAIDIIRRPIKLELKQPTTR